MINSRLIAALALAAVLITTGCYRAGAIGGHRARRAEIPARPPMLRGPADSAGAALFETATKMAGRRILISLHDRWLWLLDGADTLFAAPAAVGMAESFTFGGKTFRFETPRGRHAILGKAADPRWVPPDWHYFEIAADRDLEPVQLKRGQKIRLSDSTMISVRGVVVGRINRYGAWWPFTPGTEIIFDGKIFIPPFGSPQREIPRVLGTHKIDLGDGYLIHGTDENQSIGQPVTHGCIRLHNKDIAWLFQRVETGTPVFIF